MAGPKHEKRARRASAADAQKRRAAAAAAAGAKRAQAKRGKGVKARLAELTAELDTRMGDVQVYAAVRALWVVCDECAELWRPVGCAGPECANVCDSCG